jgi:hypothetical protein
VDTITGTTVIGIGGIVAAIADRAHPRQAAPSQSVSIQPGRVALAVSAGTNGYGWMLPPPRVVRSNLLQMRNARLENASICTCNCDLLSQKINT